MAQNTDATVEEQIETTLTFDVEQYLDYEPFERVAEAVIERGSRRVDYIYDIIHEDDTNTLRVSAKYYLDGELVNDSVTTQKYETDGDRVYHTDDGQELRDFIEANAFADPEVTLTEEFESMVTEE